ncbi:Primosomal protein N' [[Clostridium] ultunense Esp]|uniref:Replication restart protein PriA n=1 Tax=[Clostridium] ultunense Esp TaxID=1288971 RepID=M1ZCZ8_9FIRM|nr:primosomal protein N' [Schnuerera ultunensis]CCQ96054.1 Primosomal protein N' [[Clostridium] ultunense Esp]SHD76947.1 primosomal replication factor Y (primosomal protein N') [[Clostridium] ultunense Esp]
MNKKYAQVVIDNKASSTDKPYTYLIDSNMLDSVEEGMRVLVPFGRGNKVIKGIVINVQEDYEKKYQLKKIIDIIDDKPLISKDLIDLSIWMSKEYLSPYIDALQTVLPPGDFKEVKTNIILKELDSKVYVDLNPLEKNIVDLIKEKGGKIELEFLKGLIKNKVTNKVIRELEKKGIIETSLEIQTSIEKKYEKFAFIKDSSISYEEMLNIIGKRSYKQLEIAKYLWTRDEISIKELMTRTDSSLSTIKALERKGIIGIFEKEVYRTPIKKDIKPYEKLQLSLEQRYCVDTILESINNGEKNNKFLIHGVTGSGKTEIYLQLVEEMIKRGKETIVLVPEIALTPQTIHRFVGRFGDNVALLHSKLSFGERFDQWRKVKEGKVKIVVGARSAIFAPFTNLGLIIIDEEHESTYKSSMNPKYDTIEVAEKRCEQLGAFLVQGSATPSIESYYRSRKGDTKLLNLKKRVKDKKLPEVKIVDMREELKLGNKSIFSKELYEAIDENLKVGNQTILFLNRRGYSTFVSCRQCGYVVKCSECSISMTYHLGDNKLKCHYCGLAINPPKICPVCRSKYIKYFGIGTEKVEEFTRKFFPKAVVKRMDMDTTSRKGSHESILNKMKDEKIDILIGTQMVAKGLDFKNVTLVGIIAADTSLNLPDFRSSERTFQLITQVAGRAGRGDLEGKVVVQTYNPDHYSIQYAKDHDYLAFYNKEILLRKEFNYPPFVNLISIVIYGEDNMHVGMITRKIYNLLIENIEDSGLKDLKDSIVGPFPAPLEKIKKNYRYQIIIKSKDEYMEQLKQVIEWVCILNRNKIDLTGVKFNIDINPNSIL